MKVRFKTAALFIVSLEEEEANTLHILCNQFLAQTDSYPALYKAERALAKVLKQKIDDAGD